MTPLVIQGDPLAWLLSRDHAPTVLPTWPTDAARVLVALGRSGGEHTVHLALSEAEMDEVMDSQAVPLDLLWFDLAYSAVKAGLR